MEAESGRDKNGLSIKDEWEKSCLASNKALVCFVSLNTDEISLAKQI